MIYEFMKNHSMQFEITIMAKVFKVSRAGYYKSIDRQESKRQQTNKVLLEKIKAVYTKSRENYGSPRIHFELKKRGEQCSRKKVAKLMQVNKIRAKSPKRWRVSTKPCRDLARIAPNLVNQNFNAPAPNRIWVSDITYVRTKEGWLYVAAIMDLFSRRIVGLGMSDHIDTLLIKRAFAQAVCHRRPSAGLILHSDRGSQYASDEYKLVTVAEGMKISMSGKGNCYDNAAMESFFGTLKMEHVFFCEYQTRQEAAQSIFEYIEVFYNRQRIHSTLGYLTPDEFERKYGMQYPQLGESRVKLALPATEVTKL
jgi:putative transposase